MKSFAKKVALGSGLSLGVLGLGATMNNIYNDQEGNEELTCQAIADGTPLDQVDFRPYYIYRSGIETALGLKIPGGPIFWRDSARVGMPIKTALPLSEADQDDYGKIIGTCQIRYDIQFKRDQLESVLDQLLSSE